ncbi:hypothetical protein BKI52_07980 [marine bacterium AO1-C]|nr:hypothetical protein BKI52_07980 [marine bacterium AO1-C]
MMEDKIYSKTLETSNGTAYFHIEAKTNETFLRISWDGFINEERAKAGLLEQVEALSETKRLKLLVDNRQQTGPFPKGIEEWIALELMPKINRLGQVKAAHILSDNVFTEYSAKKLEESSFNDKQNANLENFASEDEAIQWLIG